jgi:hypothetical protein
LRVPIPEAVASQVLFEHAHTCCVCNEPNRSVQIHHIDDDNSNNAAENLAVLCLDDHEATQLRGGFGRKLKAAEVTRYRDDWISRVKQRRVEADRIIMEKLAGAKLPEIAQPAVEWKRPSELLLAAYIESLPDILRHAYAEARKLWDTGYHRKQINGTKLIIDVLEQSWVHLSSWFAPHHFGGQSGAIFFSNYLSTRYLWNGALGEPQGYGTLGQHGHLMYVHNTLLDAQKAVAETVLAPVQIRAFLAAHRLGESRASGHSGPSRDIPVRAFR